MTEKLLRAQETTDLALMLDSDESLIENDTDTNVSWILADSDIEDNRDDEEEWISLIQK